MNSLTKPHAAISMLILTFLLLISTNSFFTETGDFEVGFSLLATVIATCVIFTVIFFCRLGYINNPDIWFLVGAVGLIITVFLAKIAWIDLFEPHMLRVDDPLAVQDANKYELSAYLLLNTGRGLAHWQSYAIDRYIMYIYKVFGVDAINVTLVNYYLRFLTVLIASAIYKEISGRNNDYISFLYFLPLGLYYTLMASKEPLTLVFFTFFVFFLIRVFKRFTLWDQVFLLMSLTAVAAVRMNLGLFCVVTYIILLVYFTKKVTQRLSIVFFSLLCIFPLDVISSSYLNASLVDLIFKYSDSLDVASKSESMNEGGLAGKIKSLTISFGVVGYVLMLPLKAILVLLSPFPLLGFDIANFTSITGNKGKVAVTETYNFFSTYSALINVVFLVPILTSIKNAYNEVNPALKLFCCTLIVVVCMISLVYFSGFTRIRVLFEILLFTLLFLVYKYDSRHFYLALVFLIVGLFLNLLIKLV